VYTFSYSQIVFNLLFIQYNISDLFGVLGRFYQNIHRQFYNLSRNKAGGVLTTLAF
jgi:hypothetical protein